MSRKSGGLLPTAHLLLVSDRTSQIGERFLIVPTLFLRFAQAARAPFRRTITALGEPSFQWTGIIQSTPEHAHPRIFR